MRTRTAEWFETKIKYEKTMEDGQQKKVTESYVVDALSFTEAERRITEEMSSYISGEFELQISKKPRTRRFSSATLKAQTVGTRPSFSLSLSMKRQRRRSVRMSTILYRLPHYPMP